MISTKTMRSTIAGVWCFFCKLRHASAMTSALSPDRMMLTRMIWARPLQKAGVSSIPMILPVPAPVIAALTPSLRWLEVLVQPLRRGKPDERSRRLNRMAIGAGYNKMFPVSWSELHRDARALAWRLVDLGPFKGLVTITRGGL